MHLAYHKYYTISFSTSICADCISFPHSLGLHNVAIITNVMQMKCFYQLDLSVYLNTPEHKDTIKVGDLNHTIILHICTSFQAQCTPYSAVSTYIYLSEKKKKFVYICICVYPPPSRSHTHTQCPLSYSVISIVKIKPSKDCPFMFCPDSTVWRLAVVILVLLDVVLF